MSSAYDHRLVETKWNDFWKKNQFFKADAKSSKPPFCVVLPPPNVTGRLHMGHALGGTVQDILSRFKRMQGFETLWLPGLDHAGISTQTVVEKHLIKKFGKTRKEYDRETFLGYVWEWKEEHEHMICSQLEQLGCSLDWSRKRFTMDEGSNKAVRTIFKNLYDKGLIYRGDYLVNWDPVTQTALADDEVEYDEVESSLWHIFYPVENTNETITVATTRPETLLGDTAIAVHPEDERYKHLIGKMAIVPVVERKIPIIADPFVDPTFGTGAVKITPAHDFNDYEAGLRNHLPMINIMTDDGKINEQGLHFAGMTMEEARKAMVEYLKATNLLAKIEPHTHRVGKSYRSKAVIEPYLSKQWFVKMSAFKEDLLKAVREQKVELIPSHFDKTYFHWIENIRDWCISRQLWWGHRIPVWYHRYDPSIMICHDGEDVPEEVKKNPDNYKQDEDVLDTWFSSALWPFSTLGWPNETADLAKFFPTSVLVTGHDILFFWVARMILMSHFALNQPPFHQTFIHGLIYGKSYWRQLKDGSIQYVTQEERQEFEKTDKLPKDVHSKWEKMSKSKGNIIDPLEMIELYGADAVRMALCASLTDSRQIDLDRRRFEEYKNFANKLWNAARFVLMNLKETDHPDALTIEDLKESIDESNLLVDDRFILSKLNRLIEQSLHSLESFDFDAYAIQIYTFLWDEYCAYYLETCKPYMSKKVQNEKIAKNKQKILLFVLINSLKLLHPITPFITEEIFQMFKERFPLSNSFKGKDEFMKEIVSSLKSPALCIASYPKSSTRWIDEQAENNFSLLKEVVYSIRNLRGEMQIPPGSSVEISIEDLGHSAEYEQVLSNETMIQALVKIDPIKKLHEISNQNFSSQRVRNLKIIVYLPLALIEKEKERLGKEKEKIEQQLSHLLKQMENVEFVEKAPKPLLEKTKANIELLQGKLKDIEAKL
jgi:valyl-tRNA synthetase